MMSAGDYHSFVNSENGKSLRWTTKIHDKFPLEMKSAGPSSEDSLTITHFFQNAVNSNQDRPAMWIERERVKLCWTWNQKYADSIDFSKSCLWLNCGLRTSIANMGFNASEWAMAAALSELQSPSCQHQMIQQHPLYGYIHLKFASVNSTEAILPLFCSITIHQL